MTMRAILMSDDDRHHDDSTGRRFRSEMHRRQRGKNLALAAALIALMVLFYIVAIVRMGGG